MDAINVAQDLENWFQISCVRRIQVNLNAKGKKVPIGEDNSLTPEQIANDCGNPNSNTLSIYIKHLPGIAVIDFDTKELDGCELWELCCQRMYLRTETRGTCTTRHARSCSTRRIWQFI
jgi:hypothetical protein